LTEIRYIRDIVEQLLGFLQGNPEDFPSLQKMSSEDDVIFECHMELQRLEGKLKLPMNSWKQFSRKLFWPLQETDASRILNAIHRMKGVIEFGLAVDSSSTLIEIKHTTNDLRERMKALTTNDHISSLEMYGGLLDWLDAPDQSGLHLQLQNKRAENSGS
jgi:hypothetical protein